MRLLIPCYDLSTIRNSLQENLQLREIGAESGVAKCRKFPVFFPVSSELGRKVSARLLSLPFSLRRREKITESPTKQMKLPVFCDSFCETRAGENGAEQ